MCYKVSCVDCTKATWAGCGLHIDTALQGVPDFERCTCNGRPATQEEFNKLMGQINSDYKPGECDPKMS
jgi:hypothetical protein